MRQFRNLRTRSLVPAAVMPAWGEWEEVTPALPTRGTPEPEPDEAEAETPTVEAAPATDREVGMPSSRASVKTWVEFMAEHEIPHDEGATKAEMRAAATKLLSE